MKIILLVLALAAVALAAPADDNERKSEKLRERGNTEYDANLNFNWRGDGTWKKTFEAALKPIADALQALGFNGNLNSESDGKSGGDVSGHFRLVGGRRGNGESLSQGGNATISSSSSSAAAASRPVAVTQESNLPAVRPSRNVVPPSG